MHTASMEHLLSLTCFPIFPDDLDLNVLDGWWGNLSVLMNFSKGSCSTCLFYLLYTFMDGNAYLTSLTEVPQSKLIPMTDITSLTCLLV